MSTTWGPAAGAAFRAYVLQKAVNANAGIERVADLARLAKIQPSLFSKWFAGEEQPSVKSLEKLAPVIKAPLPELLVLACRVRAEDLGMDAAPEAPSVLDHPLARELDALLAEDSPLPIEDRQAIEVFMERYLEPYRRAMKTRRRRHTA